MNKVACSLILLICINYCSAQIITIPDPNFKEALIYFPVADLGNGILEDVDTNNNQEIEVLEAEAVLELYVGNKDIFIMEGIQYFINLKILDCQENYFIETLNTSQLSNLEVLNCGINSINFLDVSNNLYLKELRCQYNSISHLNVNSNQNLELLHSYNNSMITINVTGCFALKELNVYQNNLTELNLQNNLNLEDLTTAINPLETINVSNNINLKFLWCSSNDLTTIDVSDNINLLELWCFSNELTSIDVTSNTMLEKLYFGSNNVSSIEATNLFSLEELSFWGNQITEIDLSQNIYLKELNCSNNQITSLDVSGNPLLEKLNCRENDLGYLNIKNENNNGFLYMSATANSNLYCIQVDDENFANVQTCNNSPYWCKDEIAVYSEYCNLGVNENEIFSFIIYPNPTSEILNIETQILNIETINIINLQGVIVKEKTNSAQIDVSDLATGVYFVQVSSEGNSVTKKFIKI